MGRLFQYLEPHDPPGRRESDKERHLDELAASMRESDAESADPELDNPAIPAAYSHFAELVEHDMTFDAATLHLGVGELNAVRILYRAPLVLDSVYGGGPAIQPYLYDQEGDPGSFLIQTMQEGADSRSAWRDLPRNGQGRALIGDPRNDANPVLAQLHLAFLRFHNAAFAWAKEERGLFGEAAFREARREVVRHYQWIVLHDLLKRLVGARLVSSILPSKSDDSRKPRLSLWEPGASVPLEFSAAAFLARHSMTRERSDLNDLTSERQAPTDHSGPERADEPQGFRPLRRHETVQWNRFVPVDGSRPQWTRRLNTMLSPCLFTGANSQARSLAAQILVQGWRLGLPSGQDVARAMGHKPIRPGHDPLWFYVLSEAECSSEDGERLAGIGARIVAEVVVGLLANDPRCFLNCDPNWEPHFGAHGGEFDLSDLLRFAGMPLKAEELPFSGAAVSREAPLSRREPSPPSARPSAPLRDAWG